MSDDTEIKENDYYSDWLERSISDEHTKFYEYSDFKNIKQIGIGGSGKVFRANWKNPDRLFALKSFEDKVTSEEFINEVT